jgi:exodeoxyribonuclease VIII
MIVTGIYTNLSSEEYHGDKNSISRSALMDFKRNPRKYWAKHLNPDRPPNETKPSWEFGTAFHTLILEYHFFLRDYTFEFKKLPLLKDVGREEYELAKERKEIWENHNKNKIILSLKDWNTLHEMRNSLEANPKACGLIQDGIYESSYFWEDEHSGLMLKSRPDILHSNIYVDLKTIDDASPQNYQREMAKYGYHIQAAMVKDAVFTLTGEKLSACINICVEKSYPYSIGIYIIDEAAIEQGQYEYKNLCLELKNAIMLNEFRDYEVQTIGLPKWAL